LFSLLQSDISLRELNSFGLDVRARNFVRVDSIQSLAQCYQETAWLGGPYFILGGGTNLLLTRDMDGVVIQVALRGKELAAEDAEAFYVQAAAGEKWDDLVQWTLEQGYPGLENLARIPGSVGAAPIQNIGAYGIELAQRFQELEAFDPKGGELVRLDAAACGFGYRDSLFKSRFAHLIVTHVTLRLPKVWKPVLHYGELKGVLAAEGTDTPTPRQVARVVAAIRREKLPDPAEVGNAGSFFKNPLVSSDHYARLLGQFPQIVGYRQDSGSYKLAAAWLIDQCGWKGRSMGRAGVHQRQPLVLVNRGGATGAEVLALAGAISESVHSRFGVGLETEVIVV